ncbi:MAG: hypothetical protein E6Q95_00245 [Chitinophagaceae bacterium]|nr:MAG: hypothetical protein E6Q95_00245 [Chitinophagaceae bacterium]
MINKIVILIFILMAACCSSLSAQHVLVYQFENEKDAVLKQNLKLKEHFTDKDTCFRYIQSLKSVFSKQGYITASVDSIAQNEQKTKVFIYVGDKYVWQNIIMDSSVNKYLDAINIPDDYFKKNEIDPEHILLVQQKILHYLERIGYPFAKIYLDDVKHQQDVLTGIMKVKTGPLFKIDSIEVIGNAKISNEYLSRFLELRNGTVYNKDKIDHLSNRLKQLNYIIEKQAPQLVWSPTGVTVQLFLDQKKSSQINVIVGVLPNTIADSKSKTMVTGEANILLENALGSGEKIGFNWQKLQAASQNLNLDFLYPYVLKSPFGIDLSFDMIKRDSSFLNIDLKLGVEYASSNQRKLKLFFNQFNSIANTIDKNQIIQTKKLPAESSIQFSSFGMGYQFNNTNYIFNPISGWDIQVYFNGGYKKVKKNNQILQLKDPLHPNFNFASLYDTVQLKSIQSKSVIELVKYTPIGDSRRLTLKSAMNSGLLLAKKLYVNELFQIGGSRLLRGFNDHSEFLSKYIIGTVELRYLIGQNAFFNVFSDGGWGSNKGSYLNNNYQYLSGGLGLALETKAGVFNIAWAVGKRNDIPFSFKQSKIHFGFASFF